MTRVAIIAAMPAELKPLVRGWRHERRNGVDLWRWRFDEGRMDRRLRRSRRGGRDARLCGYRERWAPSTWSSPLAGRAH
jgi:hypothetical protein